MSSAEVTQLASTIAAALAAIGSVGAASVMYRQWSASRTPAQMMSGMPSGRMFVNYGASAKQVSFVAVHGRQACMEALPPHGFLGPGERARLRLGVDFVDPHEQIAVVYGYDVTSRYVYAWAANGCTQRWQVRSRLWHRGPAEVTALEVLRRFYPKVRDPTTLERRSTVLLETPPGSGGW